MSDAPDADSQLEAVRAGYAFPGAAVELGAPVPDGVAHPDAPVRIPLAVMNRHGLVAGATGTGKTKTLQLMAEQLSAQGVPVFLADVKGDLSGMASARRGRRAGHRPRRRGRADWTATAYPIEFLALGGLGTGVPVRATVTSFGPTLLAKVLGLNATQESSPRAGLPLRRQQRPAAARPQGPARGHQPPDQRRGQGRPGGARRPVHRRRPA